MIKQCQPSMTNDFNKSKKKKDLSITTGRQIEDYVEMPLHFTKNDYMDFMKLKMAYTERKDLEAQRYNHDDDSPENYKVNVVRKLPEKRVTIDCNDLAHILE